MADEAQQTSGEAWGDPISEERKAELQALFERQEKWADQPEATRGDSAFKDVWLTGADVYWLALWLERDFAGGRPGLHLEGAVLREADLEEADLMEAHLEEAFLGFAHLERAELSFAHLEKANLSGARLEKANLRGAHLDATSLAWAQLEGTVLAQAHLEGAYLSGATFDKASHLGGAVLTGASLDQVTYDGVNLTVVDWGLVPALGDESTALKREDEHGKPKSKATRLNEFSAAVRANRVLAVTLRSQGMSEDADRYAYRAQVLQRTVLRLRGKRLAAVGSWLLDFISGYGYEPLRSLATYVIVILGFAVAYRLLGNNVTPPLGPLDAVVFSVTSFHGRGFSPGEVVTLHNPLTVLAAFEAILGLLIEITFIATFTQRFFAR